MSSHFSLVIMCDLREDTPSSCIEMIEWLSNSTSDPATKPDFNCLEGDNELMSGNFDFPFLATLPEEEVVSSFQKHLRYRMPVAQGGADVYHYALQFSARDILDDGFYDCYLLFLDWLASYIEDGFIGYYKEYFDDQPTLLYVKNRKLVERS